MTKRKDTPRDLATYKRKQHVTGKRIDRAVNALIELNHCDDLDPALRTECARFADRLYAAVAAPEGASHGAQ